MRRHFIDQLRDGLRRIRATANLNHFRCALEFMRECPISLESEAENMSV